MKAKQINIALEYLRYIFQCIGLTEVTTYNKIGIENYYLTPTKDDAKAVTIVFHSPLNATNSVAKMEEYGIVADLVKEKPHPKQPGKIIVALKQAYLLHEKANTTTGIIPCGPTKEVIKEQDIIENIFKKEMLIFTSTYVPADHELQVSFSVAYYCQKAAALLKERQVVFVDDDKDMYISLALPDALLNGLLVGEGVAEKNTRYIGEFGQRLTFILKHQLGFKVLAPQGTGMPKTGIVFLSGNAKGFQRLAFSSETVKRNTVAKLQEHGFHYENPKSRELNVVIIDLIKTKPAIVEIVPVLQETVVAPELLQEEEDQTDSRTGSMTIPELKEVLKKNKVPTKNVTPVKANEDKLIFENQQVFYFDTKVVAAKAAEFLKRYFDGITISYSEGKSVMVPDRIFRKISFAERGKGGHGNEQGPTVEIEQPVLKSEDRAVIVHPIDEALNILRKAIREEIEQSYYLIKKEGRLEIPAYMVKKYTNEKGKLSIPIEPLVLMKYM